MQKIKPKIKNIKPKKENRLKSKGKEEILNNLRRIKLKMAVI